MRTRSTWSVAVALACSCGSAAGQTVLSEGDAQARLSADSPRVRAIRSGIDLARADVLNVGRWPNPRINVDRESVAGVSETITTVLQPLPITGRRALERDSASAQVEAATRRADDALRRARADLRLAYVDLVAAQVRERELTHARDRLAELAGMLEKRETAGDAAGFDRLRAEREVVEVDAERARAQGVLASFFAAGTEHSTLVAEERTVSARELPSVDALVEHAGRTRGEPLALLQEIESARLSRLAADRRRIPEPEVIAGTKSSTALGGDVGSVVAIQAVLPLFDRGRPEHALALARETQATARLETFHIVLRAEITALHTAASATRSAADRYRASALRAAGEVERIARVSYDAGERGILELLDAYRTSASARVRQAALDAFAREAEIELEFVSGWEIP
jgi:outer membrane protein, heavy metal efflux system